VHNSRVVPIALQQFLAIPRPLGTTLYFMPPYVITPEEINLLARIATEGIELACA